MVIIKQKVLTEREKQTRYKVVKYFVRESIQEFRWSQAVKARAHNVCADCGGIGTEAHHIKPIGQVIEENDIQTAEQALTCPAVFDVGNGVCVCKECHAKRHPENANGHPDGF